MWTSHYAAVKQLPPDVEPVAISRGIPTWYRGRREQCLAPSWAMLKMPPAEYDAHFAQILAGLDPRAVLDRLGDQAVLLCWERPNVRCHRRAVAEWFERELGVIVPEFGFARAESPPFAALPPKRSARAGRSLFD